MSLSFSVNKNWQYSVQSYSSVWLVVEQGMWYTLCDCERQAIWWGWVYKGLLVSRDHSVTCWERSQDQNLDRILLEKVFWTLSLLQPGSGDGRGSKAAVVKTSST